MRKESLSDELLKLIEDTNDKYENFMSHVIINDSIYNPTGLYKLARHYSKVWGTHYYTDLYGKRDFLIPHTEYDKALSEGLELKYSHYIPNDPEEHVIVLTDNLNNLTVEKSHNGDLREAINDWSRKYCRQQISMHWKWSILNVIQQGMETEKKQFTNSGTNIVEKLKPSISGLGNSRECARDHLIFTGLFKPFKYGINSYRGYDTSLEGMGTSFMSLIFEKNRVGADSFELPVYFDGATEVFKELPKPDDITKYITYIKNHTYYGKD
jgi:hypothetical protein